jgi:hypothetical protein
VLKTHGPLFPDVAERLGAGDILASSVIRDPREIALSMVDHGLKSRRARRPEFAECHGPLDAIASLDEQIARFRDWSRSRNTLVFNFNEVAFETDAVVANIAKQIGTHADPSEVLAPFRARRNIGEFNHGAARRYREMPESIQAVFLERYESLYREVSFETFGGSAIEHDLRDLRGQRIGPISQYLGKLFRWSRAISRASIRQISKSVVQTGSARTIESEKILFEHKSEELDRCCPIPSSELSQNG